MWGTCRVTDTYHRRKTMKMRRLLASIVAAGALVAVAAVPASAKGRPPCPGGSYVGADGIVICLK
jgi:hypothetical protein